MSQYTGKGDLRTRRTRLALRDALMGLIEEKGFDDLIVQEIADRAMINRVTFYKHYRDKYDLLEQTMHDLVNELAAPVETLLQQPGDPQVYNALVVCLEQVARYRSFYRTMLGRKGNPAFAAQLRDYMEEMVRRIGIPQVRDPVRAEKRITMSLRFTATGFLGVMEWWLDQPQPLPVPEVAAHLQRLLGRVMDPRPW